jgi:hypothetical protein
MFFEAFVLIFPTTILAGITALKILILIVTTPPHQKKLRDLNPLANYTDLPSYRLLLTKLIQNFADGSYHVVRVTYPHGRNLRLLDRNRYFFFQVAPQ